MMPEASRSDTIISVQRLRCVTSCHLQYLSIDSRAQQSLIYPFYIFYFASLWCGLAFLLSLLIVPGRALLSNYYNCLNLGYYVDLTSCVLISDKY